MNKREKHLLWMILRFSIYRYILCNEFGRLDGYEKADRHIYISKILCHYILGDGGIYTIRGCDDEFPRGWEEVHNLLADKITDKLDETIGFVIDRPLTQDERKSCVHKMFDMICDIMPEIEQTIYQSDPDLNITFND